MLDTIDDILDFAIKEEEGAAAFYRDLAGRMENAETRKVFEEFAQEEEGHKAKLQDVKAGKAFVSTAEHPLDLKIAEQLVKVDPFRPDLDYQQALVVAMKKEKAAYLLYMNLAKSAEDATIRDLFVGLANEEAKHKLRFEIEYDDNIMIWN
ncbi:MAG: ferritin-like domain-containing protein [Candidatus Sumerlaeia bacterium]